MKSVTNYSISQHCGDFFLTSSENLCTICQSDVKKYMLTANWQVSTLDSGIDVASGINVAHGTFGKNIKRSP